MRWFQVKDVSSTPREPTEVRFYRFRKLFLNLASCQFSWAMTSSQAPSQAPKLPRKASAFLTSLATLRGMRGGMGKRKKKEKEVGFPLRLNLDEPWGWNFLKRIFGVLLTAKLAGVSRRASDARFTSRNTGCLAGFHPAHLLG